MDRVVPVLDAAVVDGLDVRVLARDDAADLVGVLGLGGLGRNVVVVLLARRNNGERRCSAQETFIFL